MLTNKEKIKETEADYRKTPIECRAFCKRPRIFLPPKILALPLIRFRQFFSSSAPSSLPLFVLLRPFFHSLPSRFFNDNTVCYGCSVLPFLLMRSFGLSSSPLCLPPLQIEI